MTARIPLSQEERAYILWALEHILPDCDNEEEEILWRIIEKLQRPGSPFAPLRSLSEWRSSVLSRSFSF